MEKSIMLQIIEALEKATGKKAEWMEIKDTPELIAMRKKTDEFLRHKQEMQEKSKHIHMMFDQRA